MVVLIALFGIVPSAVSTVATIVPIATPREELNCRKAKAYGG
jgi:hypothetical protein